MKRRTKGRKPKEFRSGSFVAKLYKAAKTINGKPYRYVRLAYYLPGGTRVVRDFASDEAAMRAAKEASKAFALGRPDALSFTPAEQWEYEAAAQALEGRGLTMFGAVQKFLAEQQEKPQIVRTVAQACAELIAGRQPKRCLAGQ
ncbi:MAG: hypothetical protein KIT22_15200 [Verrucomicrobiae bacterium]|nr:hypothetical protein [Verrucomicrobiae bacterium]